MDSFAKNNNLLDLNGDTYFYLYRNEDPVILCHYKYKYI